MITAQQLQAIMPTITAQRINTYIDPLNKAMLHYGIVLKLEICGFIANVIVESGQLIYTKELWGPSPTQLKYERDFDHAWPPTQTDQINHKAWELGNDQIGDGKKHRGYGLIQETGKGNHAILGKELGLDLINHPELLEEPINACMSAAYFWKSHGLNEISLTDDFLKEVKIINGGTTAYEERLGYYNKAKGIIL